MKLATGVCFVLILALLVSAHAGDLTPIGTLSTPDHITQLTGLDHAEGNIFAVSDPYGEMSCFFLINRWNAEFSDTCFSMTIFACDDDSLNFKANAYISGDEPGAGDYVAADECGAIARYQWYPGGGFLDTVQSFIPSTMIEDNATGLTYESGWYLALEPGAGEIHQIDRYTLETDSIIPLPDHIQNGSGLTVYGENFLVVSYSSDSLWVVDWDGRQVDSYRLLGSPAYPTGITAIGDSIYICSQDTTIRIYTVGESYSEPVPVGVDVEVKVVPDEATVTFDSVSTSGTLDVDVTPTQPCPPPGGVLFFSDYYDMNTGAVFEYIATVELMTEATLPGYIDTDKVRVFKRPSGEPCEPWRDITVAPLEFFEQTFRSLTRTLSEDDEFSMFVLGEDNRNPRAVIDLKFTYLDSAVIGNAGSIPNDTYNAMLARISAAKGAYAAFKYARAARLVDGVADMARADEAIPHTYDPDGVLVNVAGQIIGRAHTLSFSIRQLITETGFGPGLFQGKSGPQKPAEEFAPRLGLVPNPSVSGCTVTLSGSGNRPVTLSIYSVTGELVKTLLDHEMVTGSRTIKWDGDNSHGERVAAGTYFAVLKQGEQLTTRKVILNQ
jgi:hypothetical protein